MGGTILMGQQGPDTENKKTYLIQEAFLMVVRMKRDVEGLAKPCPACLNTGSPKFKGGSLVPNSSIPMSG